ncbi:flagellar biosynthesis protein FlgA [Candidatus Aerophobetes bacterium]|uniref:Flagellar P-ring protein n=1 Tax=Aerophobetes bacterium TaxID=2030807 RepID=A0A662CYJ8_UNCAE|nr:MAG: flagellar biosynthesis protein FlgA [Candidatus Aerophobetes bacterium]
MKKTISILLILMTVLFTSLSEAEEIKVRIKDIARIKGAEEVQLFGYGLVVGLNGTGDKRGSTFTIQSISNMLQRLGISVDPQKLRLKNVAAVMVTCNLSPFIKAGNYVDVTVSSIGDASSLQGGTLLLTPLQGMDGEIYVLAQGPLSIGGFNVSGGGGTVQKNHPLVGRIPRGGIVKKELPLAMVKNKDLSLILSQPDFTTASRIADVINEVFPDNPATALDAGMIKIKIPEKYTEEGRIVNFISQIGELPVVPDMVAKVVINERTGTIVVGKEVKISPVAVSHGNLLVTVKVSPVISQPPPFSEGETVVKEKEEIEVKEEKGKIAFIKGTTVEELVRALNGIGASPRDIIAIFQAIKEAGALQGELVII